MGKGGCRVLMVLVSAAVVGLMMAGTARGQMMSPSPAPSPGVDCSGALVSAANCFNYVSEGSNLTSPGSACCSSIEGLITNSPVCLCQLIANSGSLGIPVDRKRALGLPHACKFSAPPLSACSLLGVPIPGPSEAPAPAKSGGKAPMTSKTPASPSPSPGGGGGSSDCNAAYMSAFSCLDYITLGSNLTSPSSDCCSGVKNLVTKEPVCLCQLLGASSPPGISIDRKRALGLAGACKAPTLPPGYCSKVGVPIPGPSVAPSPGKAPMASETPASPSPSPEGGGGGSSDCNAAYMSAFSCLDYISSGSNLTSPSSDCCSGVKNLVTKEPACLCQLLAHPDPQGISIDRKRALGLAGACKAPTLRPGYCSSTRSPSSAPEASEPTTGVSTIKGNSIRRFGFRPSVLLSAATAMFVTGATIAIF